MPLTALQRQILSLLAANRTPESHVAGGAAINRAEQSPRYSSDLDFFHDTAGKAVTPNPDTPDFIHHTRHFGSIRGAWPRLTEQA